jgi:hypothetical protein
VFQGSIPDAVRRIIGETVRGWDCQHIAIGCSGNLTVERVLHDVGGYQLHSNDVSIYTSILGSYYAGQPLDLALSPVGREAVPWVRDFMETPTQRLATLLLATRFGEFLNADGTVRGTGYHRRMYEATRDQWAVMHAQTVARIEGVTLKLSSFGCEDAATWIQRVPADYGVITYPSFYAKGYDRLYKVLDAFFDWERPSFVSMDEPRMLDYLKAVTSRDYWMFSTQFRIEDLDPQYQGRLIGITYTTAHGVPIYVYASKAPTRIVTPTQNLEPVLVPRLAPDAVIGSRISIAPISGGQLNSLRSQYLNPQIAPATALAAYAVLADGHLIGVFALGSPNSFASPEYAYILSDFPIAPTAYKRLSKLIVMAFLSKEARLLFERSLNRRVRMVMSTAFTNHPVSMKYRGLLEVMNRKELKDREFKYMVNYHAPAGQWSLQEGYDQWLTKHAT